MNQLNFKCASILGAYAIKNMEIIKKDSERRG
jgi:hypothetical protein